MGNKKGVASYGKPRGLILPATGFTACRCRYCSVFQVARKVLAGHCRDIAYGEVVINGN